MYDMRIFFSKKDLACFVSHLDLARAFSRAFFASDIPVWFSEGFNPHPFLVFSQPLPLGFAGEKEVLDIRLNEEVLSEKLINAINMHLPSGLLAVSAAPPVARLKEISAGQYKTVLDIAYVSAFEQFWSRDTIEIEKKSKRTANIIDLKQQVFDLKIEQTPQCLKLLSIMPCGSDGTVSPALLIDAFSQHIGTEVEAGYTRTGFLNSHMANFV